MKQKLIIYEKQLKGEPESLDAFLANQKIHMRWNGRIYVGNAHGMEFTTPGPKSRTLKKEDINMPLVPMVVEQTSNGERSVRHL